MGDEGLVSEGGLHDWKKEEDVHQWRRRETRVEGKETHDRPKKRRNCRRCEEEGNEEGRKSAHGGKAKRGEAKENE